MTRQLSRLLLVALMANLLGGCGFRLRQELVLPPTLASIRVETPDPNGLLQRQLEAALRRAGARMPAGDEGGAVLRVAAAALEQRPLTVGATGRVQEFLLHFRAEVELVDAAGTVVLPRQTIELDREYSFDTAAALGSPAEEEIVRGDLEQAMGEAILRRVDAVLRP
jgi:LPS-assembly lipoprotein